MKVSDIIVDFLVKNNVDTVFGYPGGNVTHILDSIHKKTEIRYIQGYHEQAVGFEANGYARKSGKIGVALSSSGPGATNMITAIADAWLDSVPCIFLCGHVSKHDQNTNPNLRQNGFQELDIVSLVASITKYTAIVEDGADILYHLEKAFSICRSGRMGPVLLELPHSVQAEDVNIEDLRHYQKKSNDDDVVEIPNSMVEGIVHLLLNSKHPVIMVGGGARHSEAQNIIALSDKYMIPIVSSMNGMDVIPYIKTNYLGFIGGAGSPRANKAIEECDFLLVLGARLEGQHTPNKDVFAQNASIIHVDIDENELYNFKRSIKIKSTVDSFLHILNAAIDDCIVVNESRIEWKTYLESIKETYENTKSGDVTKSISPYKCLKELTDVFGQRKTICADVGQHLLWTAEAIELGVGDRFLASGGLGSMGFSLPAAIGAYFSDPSIIVMSISGDGGIQMNIQELQTVRKYSIPLKMIVLNNRGLGMVRAYQEKWFHHNLGSEEGYLPEANMEKIASAYNIKYLRIETEEDIERARERMRVQEPVMIEVMIDRDRLVYSGILENVTE